MQRNEVVAKIQNCASYSLPMQYGPGAHITRVLTNYVLYILWKIHSQVLASIVGAADHAPN